MSRTVGLLLLAMGLVFPASADAQTVAPASVPALPAVPPWEAQPRTDQNSRIAHQQLLAKRTQGQIDVYFAGDSIVRRWGAVDYPHLLANWNGNFRGWNAANFGWGGDRTQNVLWRLDQGELDDVHPKVIVLLAGTNNLRIGPAAPSAVDVARGVEAIVRLMRQKAPAATIIITALFPRNDQIELMPAIDEVNTTLARLADGRSIRFLNVNERLATSDGRLLANVMNTDGLHPSVAGYQVWADALKPLLAELLGPPAAVDLAPPPTGDPSAAARGSVSPVQP